MAVAHHTPAPVLVDQARTPGDEPLDLGLDRLRQHAPGTLAQYRQQRIIGNAHSWPRQPDNAILLHGVSFLVTLNITEDTPPPASATKSSHSSRKALDAARIAYRYLPAYSPDLNPIEPCWSKLKSRLRAKAARTLDALDIELGPALATVTAQDAQGWFRLCGYATPN